MRKLSSDDYKRNAAKAEELAEQVGDPDVRVELRRLAETYREVADVQVDRSPLDSGALEPEVASIPQAQQGEEEGG
jgi:hypothetical protein